MQDWLLSFSVVISLYLSGVVLTKDWYWVLKLFS